MVAAWTVLAATLSAAPALTVGFFDPYVPFSSPLERAAFAEKLAVALSEKSNREVRGAAYSKANDLIRDLASRKVQVAFVNPQFLSAQTNKAEVKPVLVGTHKGSEMCPYALYASRRSRAKNLRQLKGRRLAIIKTGESDERFIYNAVLQGELRNRKFFRKIVAVPDLAGAVGTLKFGRAEAFFGPDIDYMARFKSRALRRIASTGSTLCTLVVVDGRLSEPQGNELTKLVADASKELRPLLRSIGLDGVAAVSRSALDALATAIHSDPGSYARARPLLLSSSEPNEEEILKMIEEMEKGLLPDPSLLVVERDGL